MILTAMAIMYGVMYLNTFQVDHVRWSEERGFMTLLMGSTMAVVMLLFMLGNYRNWKGDCRDLDWRRDPVRSWPLPGT